MNRLQILRLLLSRHAKRIIYHLKEHEIHFSLQCIAHRVSFEPKLPEEISKNFHPAIDFILSGYTFDSIEMWEDEFLFEAGFGKDNFASVVRVPFSSITQISIPKMRDMCIFMNAMNFVELGIFSDEEDMEMIQELMENMEDERDIMDDLIESSKDAILSNPENKF